MAQSSLVKPRPKPPFSDPAKARAAGNHQNKSRGPSEEFLALRRQQIIDLKVKGWTTAEIATHFNVSEDTIERDVKYIKKNGLIEKYEAKFLGRLMPLATRALEKMLKANEVDLDAVKEVLKRFDRLSDQKHQKELAEGGQKEETLSGWYDQWLAAKNAADAKPPENVVDTEIITGGEPDGGDDHAPQGEAGVDASGVGGSAGVGGTSSPETSAPTGADPGQSGVEVASEN